MKKVLCCLAVMLACLCAKQDNQEVRLVVLDPASVEILYMLDAQESIVGIAKLQQSGIYPEEQTKQLESVGSFSNPSIEKIMVLKPTLVILSSYSIALEPKLKDLHIPTEYIEANSLEDIRKNIAKIAKIVHKQEEGEKLIAEFNDNLESIRVQNYKIRGLFLYSANPLMAFGRDTLLSDIFDILGIQSIVGDVGASRPILSVEHILKENPQIIIYGVTISDSKELLEQQPMLKNTDAFRQNRVYHINSHTLLRGSPMIVERIKEIAKQLGQ